MRHALAPLALLLLAGDAAAYRGQPPSGRAGDPPDSRTCQACHGDFALNSGDVTLSLVEQATGRPLSSYEPGIGYDLVFEVSSGEAGRDRWGFELIPLAGESMAGELSAGPSSTLLGAGDRTYLAHAPALNDPALGSWSFAWTAPPAEVGDIVFWACGNAANGDGDNDGDYIECGSFTLTAGAAPGGAVTRVVRWLGEPVDAAAAAFGEEPCSTPSEDLRLCEETALQQETLDGPLPVGLGGEGRLVFIEHDSDTSTPGTADLLMVAKDPSNPGGLLVTAR